MPSSPKINTLLTEALTWSPEDRLEAAELLVASVPCDLAVEKAQLEEVLRRGSQWPDGPLTRTGSLGSSATDCARRGMNWGFNQAALCEYQDAAEWYRDR